MLKAIEQATKADKEPHYEVERDSTALKKIVKQVKEEVVPDVSAIVTYCDGVAQ